MATRSAISETKKTTTVKKTAGEDVKETPVTVSLKETVKPEAEKAEPAEKPVKAAAKPVEEAAEKKEEKKAPEKKTPEKKTSTRATAKKETTTKKETTKKAAPKKETAKKAAAPKKETTAKRTTAKKETVKKETTVKRAASRKEIKINAIVEHHGKQIGEQDIIANVKTAWTDSGRNEKDIKSLELYIKPEENAVYYVVNGTETGKVALYE